MSIDTLKQEIARRYGTPAHVIDLDIVERNIARLQSTCDAAGIANRPHIKTHKSPLLAAKQIAAGAKGITCQKLGEAGRHARSAVGMGSLPGGISVEIEAILLVRPENSGG